MKRHQHIRKHFKKIDPVIHTAMENLDFDEWLKPEKRIKSGEEYFSALCREILGQQLSGSAANAIIDRFKNLFENQEIDAKKLLKIKDQKLRDVGMSWAKASYVKNIAKSYLENSVQFDKLHKLSDEEIKKQLISIKGVGPWTAEMFLIFTLGREDVFSFGDLGLKKGFEKLYKTKNPSYERIKKVVEKWSPYKTYGSITLWHTLDTKVVEANKENRT